MTKIEDGDVVVPRETVYFVDGTKHEKGQKIIVGFNDNTDVSYFNNPQNNKLYDLYLRPSKDEPTEREMIAMIADKV